MTEKIRLAAYLPWVIFYKAGPSWEKLKPAIIIPNITVKTSPTVYFYGHSSVPVMHFMPYQNPNA